MNLEVFPSDRRCCSLVTAPMKRESKGKLLGIRLQLVLERTVFIYRLDMSLEVYLKVDLILKSEDLLCYGGTSRIVDCA